MLDDGYHSMADHGAIARLDLIAGELHKIKKALIQAQAARDAAGKEAA